MLKLTPGQRHIIHLMVDCPNIRSGRLHYPLDDLRPLVAGKRREAQSKVDQPIQNDCELFQARAVVLAVISDRCGDYRAECLAYTARFKPSRVRNGQSAN